MKRFLLSIIILAPFLSIAQQKLNLQQAIDTALKNNFDIQIARNNAEIGKINNSFGVAGGLPSVNIAASDNLSLYNQTQKISGGTESTLNNVSSNAISANINASMILFNGFKILATKERLSSLEKQSELLLNQQIQNTMADVMTTYFDVLRQQSYIRILQSSLDLSTRKLEIIQQRKNVGMANDADLLQAQIDVNSVQQNLNTQQIVVDQQKTSLLQLMGVKQFYPVEISDTILIDKGLTRDDIFSYLKNNPQYLTAEQQIHVNRQLLREVSAQRYPSLRLNTGYNFAHNSYSAGVYDYTRNYGLNAGATLQIPLFNGTIYKSQQDAALYNLKNAELAKDNIYLSINAEAEKIFQSYQNTLQQMISQDENYKKAQQLVYIILQRFQLNQATILDVKAAQTSFENSGYLLVNLQFSAKIAEIELKRLGYKLK